MRLPPGFPEGAVEMVLGPCPDGDPDMMRCVGDGWYDNGEQWNSNRDRYAAAAATERELLGGYSGALRAEEHRQCLEMMREQVTFCHSMAAHTHEGATAIELGQLTWVGIGAVMLTQLAADAMLLHWGAAKAVADRAAAQAAWRTFLTKMLQLITTAGASATARRSTMLIASTVIGGVSGAGVVWGAQKWQQWEGNRDEIDGLSVLISGAGGAFGGVAGAGTALKVAPLVGRVVDRMATPTSSRLARVGATVTGSFLLGAAGGVGGAFGGVGGGYAAKAAATGDFSAPTGAELYTSIVTGVVGGVVGGSAYALHAAQSGVPLPNALGRIPESSRRWPGSWAARLGESGDVHRDRLDAAYRLQSLEPGTLEHAELSAQIAHVDTLAHQQLNRTIEVRSLEHRLARPDVDPARVAEPQQRHREASADLHRLNRELAPGHTDPQQLLGRRFNNSLEQPDSARLSLAAINDRFGRTVFDVPLDSRHLGVLGMSAHDLRGVGEQQSFASPGQVREVMSRTPDPMTAMVHTRYQIGDGHFDDVVVWAKDTDGPVLELSRSFANLDVPNIADMHKLENVIGDVRVAFLDRDGELIPAPSPAETRKVWVDEGRTHYENRYNTTNKGLSGWIDEAGYLHANIERGAGTPRGRVMFRDLFTAVGDKVSAVRGAWFGKPGHRVNLDGFNAGINRGLSPEEAALNTFTGTVAAEHGYTRVTFDHLGGQPGQHDWVDVVFTRPTTFENTYGTAWSGVGARIDDDGLLHVNMVAGNRTPSGREMFGEAVAALGHQARAVEGYWVTSSTLGDQLESFNAGIQNGLTPKEAASNTATGKLAREHGFTEVEIVESKVHVRGIGEADGGFGENAFIRVHFRKPGPEKDA